MIVQTHLVPCIQSLLSRAIVCHPSRPRLPCTHPSDIWHGPARSRLPPEGRGPLLSSLRRPGCTRLPRAPPSGVPRRPEPGAPQRHRLLGLPLRGLRAWHSGLDAAATRRALTHRSGAPRRPLDSSGHGFTVPRASPSRPAGQGPRHRRSFIVLSGFPSTASGPGNPRQTPRPRDRQLHIGAGAPCNSPGTRGRGPASLPSISIFVMNKQGLMRAATYEPPNPS